MSKRIYGAIQTAPELIKMQEIASKFGETAVGITKGGGLYAAINGKVEKIVEDQAAGYLDTTIDEIRKLVESKGKYVIAAKKLESFEPEEKLETELEEDSLVEEKERDPDPKENKFSNVLDEAPWYPDPKKDPELEEVPSPEEAPEYIDEVTKAIEKLENKVDGLPGEHAALLKEVKGLRADLGRFISKLDKILLD